MSEQSLHTPQRYDDDEQRWESSRRRHRSHFAISFLLVLIIAGLAWYAYPVLQRHEASLASLRDLPSLSQTVSNLGDQVKQAAQGTDQKIAAWTQAQTADRKSLREEAAEMARDLKARIETASQQAHDSLDQKINQFRAEIDDKMDGVNARVATLESSREGDQKQIAALQEVLGQVRQQVGEQATELAAVRRQVQENGSNAQERIAALKTDQDLARRDIGTIENKLAVERVPFELSKGRTRELAEGISLYVSSTDPSYRRANGWLWVSEDRRNIWLRNLAAQEPLTFYGYQDGRKRELVITNVSNSGVTGYLLLPKASRAEGRTEAAGQ